MVTLTHRPRRKKVEAESQGLAPQEVASLDIPAEILKLETDVENDGGVVLAHYREPLGKHWQLLVALPISKVKPTSFQRDLSEAHVKRLADKIGKLNRYLDPITVVRGGKGIYYTPNGHHRTSALGLLGAKTIIALLVPDFDIAYQILALNTEKAYNLREKSIEAIRMAREIVGVDEKAKEADYALQFEEPYFLTLGACYQENGRFSGGAYQFVLRRTESFSDEPLSETLKEKVSRAKHLLKFDKEVVKAVDELKARGLKNPYLKVFVIARVNPLRFSKAKQADFYETLDKMESALRKFDPSKIESRHLASMAGAPLEE